MKDRHGNTVPLTKVLDVPPVWLALALAAAWLIHRLAPVALCPSPASGWTGGLMILAGFGLAFWSASGFFRRETPIHPRRKPSVLLTDGAYAISRNPIYLAMALVLLGWTFILGSLLPLLAVPGFVLVIERRFICGEEYHIERAFGDEWRAYTRKVRRWL